MNWYAFKNTLKAKKNKILAVLLSFIGLALFLGYVGIAFARGGVAVFRDFSFDINCIILLLVYGIIFVCNVRNDNFAYQGILMFVFMTTFDATRIFLLNLGAYTHIFTAGFNLESAISVLFLLNIPALAALGVCLYVFTTKYMRGMNIEFTRVRLFGILFAGACLISTGTTLFVHAYSEAGTLAALLPYIFLESAKSFIAAAIVFTLERLRRI